MSTRSGAAVNQPLHETTPCDPSPLGAAIILKTGAEYYGSVAQIEDTTFRIAEVDLRQEMTFEYRDVKKVRRDYGGKNYISGKRPNPLWGKIAFAGLLGGLITLATLVGRS